MNQRATRRHLVQTLALVVGLAGPTAARADTATLSVLEDTFLRAGTLSNKNEGGTAFLRLQNTGDNRSVVRFDQAAIATAVGGGVLDSATLELFIETNKDNWGTTGGEVDVHRLNLAWTENGATWNCPDDANTSNGDPDCPIQWNGGDFVAAPSDSMTQVNGVSGVYAQFDVAEDVAAFLAGAPNFGWLVKKRDETKNGSVEYTSKEGTAGQHPRLVLDFFIPPTAVPTTTPTITPTATQTPTATPTGTQPPCGQTPASGCHSAPTGKRGLRLWNRHRDRRDRLVWEWRRGEATSVADFGDPLATTGYALCVYDQVDGNPTLVLSPVVLGGATCGGRPCWEATRRGFVYVNEEDPPDGICRIMLRAGDAGRTRICVKAKGPSVGAIIPFKQDPTVTVQLVNSIGECWETRYSAPAVVNDGSQFNDKND